MTMSGPSDEVERILCAWRLKASIVKEIRRIASAQRRTQVVIVEDLIERGIAATDAAAHDGASP